MCKRKTICLVVALLTVASMAAKEKDSQRVKQAASSTARLALSVNAVDLGWYFTPNLDVQYAFGPKWSADLSLKYNNWTFNSSDGEDRNRQARREISIGARFWPWYVYSGWWISGKFQYREYSRRPFDNHYAKEEGDAFGAAFAGGYSVQVTSWFNVELGLGIWLGRKSYKLYEASSACPECGRRVDVNDNLPASRSFFLMPDEVSVSAMFVF